ncbi:MAG: hypothetical protein M0R80_08865 [Proteobacteria bacterium]|jgi:hypothetical protein|nr:hypothetical protein [Pseudomonadota bacterium]
MNFKQWIEAQGMVNDPWTAMEILGLTNKSGGNLDPQELMAAYRSAAKNAHPDAGGSNQQMSLVNAAKDFLQSYGQPLPTKPDVKQKSFWDTGTSVKTTTKKEKPRGSESYTVKDLEAFIHSVMEMGATNVFVKTKVDRMPMDAEFGDGVGSRPLGSQEKKISGKDWNADQYLSFIFNTMSKDRAEYPEGIVCIKTIPQAQQPYGWITYYWSADRSWERFLGAYSADYYVRTIEFIKPTEPVAKPKDALKNRANVENYLREKGMKLLAANKDHYWGLAEHMGRRTPIGYLIETSPRVFSIIHRYQYKGSYRSEMKVITLDSKSYGQVTPAMVDIAINWVKKRYEQKGFGEKE